MRRPRGPALDAALYAASAVFAGATILFASIPIHREWAEIAVGSYAAGAIAAALVAIRSPNIGPRLHRWRVAIAVAVALGATVAPLAAEAFERAAAEDPGLHAQSEAIVTEEAATAVVHGRDPYRGDYSSGPLHARPVGTKTHFPYLPLMVVFGLPRALGLPLPLGDARVWFAIATFAAMALAARRSRASPDAKLLASQAMLVLPTGALLLTSGGDDLPVIALMLLALVLLRERQPITSGIALGLALATKQTAWLLLPFAVASRRGAKLVVAAAAVSLPPLVAFALWDPGAFFEDVVRFPLGLGQHPSAAAATTLGHAIVRSAGSHRTLATVALVATLAAVVAMLLRGTGGTSTASLARRAGVAFAVAIALAPAARLGYAMYPIDLFVAAALLKAERAATPLAAPRRPSEPSPTYSRTSGTG